jgi:hypothetical protein
MCFVPAFQFAAKKAASRGAWPPLATVLVSFGQGISIRQVPSAFAWTMPCERLSPNTFPSTGLTMFRVV